MGSLLRLAVLVLLITGCATPHPQVLLETEMGRITVEVYPENAPATVDNFLRYVDEGRLAGASFYRTVHAGNQPEDSVRIGVVQWGLGFGRNDQRRPPIAHETTAQTDLRHRDGTLSMARAAPGSASSEFFICIGSQPSLDYGGARHADGQGFAAFGRVIDGMDVVRAIQQQPDDRQRLFEPVAIVRITRLR